MFLDELPPLVAQVGYGTVGSGGSLGYEGKRAVVRGRQHDRALSTHPPARLVFHLGGRYSTFRSDVAMADDVPAGRSDATFIVLADGREAARAECVAGNGVQTLVADISGASLLELSVRTARFEYAHALWLDPRL
jgi:endo-alpha-N-acetylgalactosaminidase